MPPKNDKYFSPGPRSNNNQKRSRSSPELTGKNIKKVIMSSESTTVSVGDLNALKTELMTSITHIMANLLDTKLSALATKEEFKLLHEENQAVKEEICMLKSEVANMKASHEKIELAMEALEMKSRRNNLIFRGFKYNQNDDILKLVTDFCQQVLNMRLNSTFLLVSPLGRRDNANRPLLVSFALYADKLLVLRSIKRLKGTGFSVHNDYPENVRKKQSKLLLIRKEILKLKPDIKVFVRGDRMFVGSVEFRWTLADGLKFSGDPGTCKLCDVIGADITKFVTDVYNNSVPNNYFGGAINSTVGGALPVLRQSSSAEPSSSPKS